MRWGEGSERGNWLYRGSKSLFTDECKLAPLAQWTADGQTLLQKAYIRNGKLKVRIDNGLSTAIRAHSDVGFNGGSEDECAASENPILTRHAACFTTAAESTFAVAVKPELERLTSILPGV